MDRKKGMHRLFVMLIVIFSGLCSINIAYAAPSENSYQGGYEGPVVTGPITSGAWYLFSFTGVGIDATGCAYGPPCADNPPWTFTGRANFTVTDAFDHGDIFQIYDNGVLVGTTSTVAVSPGPEWDPDICLQDPLYSHGVFTLGPGSHSITIRPSASPFGGGDAWFRLDPAPDPIPTMTEWGLIIFIVLAGIGSIYYLRRMKRT